MAPHITEAFTDIGEDIAPTARFSNRRRQVHAEHCPKKYDASKHIGQERPAGAGEENDVSRQHRP